MAVVALLLWSLSVYNLKDECVVNMPGGCIFRAFNFFWNPLSMSIKPNSKYTAVLEQLKIRLRNAQSRAILAVNVELLLIYWEIGHAIAKQEIQEGWGAKVIDKMSLDLRNEFPAMKGLSPRNLRYMRDFAKAYPHFSDTVTITSILQQPAAKLQPVVPNNKILQQAVAKLPWGHNCVLLDKTGGQKEKLFYAQKAVENGWSRHILIEQIDSNLIERQGKTLNNFDHTLPVPQSDLAKEIFKNPYLFEFLNLTERIQERELEEALILHLKQFLLELGKGFAFLGNQFRLEVEEKEYFLDLLFFNTRPNCHIVFELKIGEFKPEFLGKLNFYVNAIDHQIANDNHKPTIGVLLCKAQNKTVINYALQNIGSPISVAEYKLLPKEIKETLPTIEELNAELNKEVQNLKHFKNNLALNVL
jgi:predicted nuclease of restriction endonuclease-like (RecB) superfamily